VSNQNVTGDNNIVNASGEQTVTIPPSVHGEGRSRWLMAAVIVPIVVAVIGGGAVLIAAALQK